MSRPKKALVVALAIIVAALFTLGGAPTGTTPAQAATCSQYANQAAAQAAADTRDADGDGVYCESLPCPCAGPSGMTPTPTDTTPAPQPTPTPAPTPTTTATAPTTPSTPEPAPSPSLDRKSGDPAKCVIVKNVVNVGLSKTKYPAVKEHWDRAIRKGYARILTINRAGASARRSKLLAGIPTRKRKDRDEYPMAMARKTVKADVAYVDSGQNRGAGSVQGIKLRRYCSGQKFKIVWY